MTFKIIAFLSLNKIIVFC